MFHQMFHHNKNNNEKSCHRFNNAILLRNKLTVHYLVQFRILPQSKQCLNDLWVGILHCKFFGSIFNDDNDVGAC